MKHKAMLAGIVCLLIGAAAIRTAMNSPRAEPSLQKKIMERLQAENEALKMQVGRLFDEPLPALDASPPKIEPPPSEPKPGASDAAVKGGFKGAADAAALLHLDPARQKYLEESYGRLVQKVLDAEKRHAQVSRREGQLEIHIPPFAEEGRAMREEWFSFLQGALTAFEHEQYKKLQLDKILFPREIGQWDRYMVYEPQKDTVWPRLENGNRHWPMFYERWSKPGEPAVDPATRWPWSGSEAYRWYKHLLDPSECKVSENP